MIQNLFFLPRKILLSFLVITLVMFMVSPWNWPLENSFIFYTLNFSFLLAFYFGYNFGYDRYKRKTAPKKFAINKYINYSLIVNLIFIYPKFLFRMKVGSLSVSELFSSVYLGLTSPSLAYASKHQSEYTSFLTLSNPLVLLYFILLPLLYFVIPLGVFYWKRLSTWQRVSYCVIVVFDILSYVAIGTNKGIFDFIILLPIILLVSQPEFFYLKKFSSKRKKLILFSILILIVGVYYFTLGNKGRKMENFEYDSSTQSFVDRDAEVLKLVPSSLEDSYIAMDNYITQGYYAMGLALNLEHKFTYGIGHNTFTSSIFDKLVGQDVIQKKTYQYRMEEQFGYSSAGKWHSIYVWMANDLTFFGVILFVFFVAYFLAQIWLDTLIHRNPFAITLLPLFFTMVFYFSANNQVLGNQGSSLVFWTYFFLWLNSSGRPFHLQIK